jgi:hypothetical protein
MTMALVVLLGACGSSSTSLSTSSRAELEQTCRHVQAVLSDGPEPQADPAGYAQAQVLPLRQIHTSEKGLREAIDGLASAYESFAAGNGGRSSQSAVNGGRSSQSAVNGGRSSQSAVSGGRSSPSAVNVAVDRVDAICPGVAS